MKIRTVEAKLFHADGGAHADTRQGYTGRPSQFYERA